MAVAASHRFVGISFALLGAFAAATSLDLPARSSAAMARPNLALSKLADPPATASPGQTLTVSLRTRNSGKRPAKATQNAFFLSGDKQRSAKDVKLEGTQRVSKLKSGKGKSGSAAVRIPSSTVAGSYFLIACADSQGKIKERSEKDNCIVSKGATTIAASLLPSGPPSAPSPQPPTPSPQGIVLSQSALNVVEGSSNSTTTVQLAFQPSANTVVSLSSSDAAAATVTPQLTFTAGNWSVPQTVTVNGVQDDDLVDATPTVTATTPGAPDATIAVTVQEDDLQDIQLSASTLNMTEGQTDTTITVRLAFKPAGNVAVSAASNDASVATFNSSNPMTFTTSNWNIPQAVSIGAPEDVDTTADQATITFTIPSTAQTQLTVNVTDND